MQTLTQDVADVVDTWIADRHLSRRKLAFLETVYEQSLEIFPQAYSVDVSGSDHCSELDLPPGCFMVQVVADLLDHLKPLDGGPTRLTRITDELVRCGHISTEEAERIADW